MRKYCGRTGDGARSSVPLVELFYHPTITKGRLGNCRPRYWRGIQQWEHDASTLYDIPSLWLSLSLALFCRRAEYTNALHTAQYHCCHSLHKQQIRTTMRLRQAATTAHTSSTYIRHITRHGSRKQLRIIQAVNVHTSSINVQPPMTHCRMVYPANNNTRQAAKAAPHHACASRPSAFDYTSTTNNRWLCTCQQ